jgi:hypothetical protein
MGFVFSFYFAMMKKKNAADVLVYAIFRSE